MYLKSLSLSCCCSNNLQNARSEKIWFCFTLFSFNLLDMLQCTILVTPKISDDVFSNWNSCNRQWIYPYLIFDLIVIFVLLWGVGLLFLLIVVLIVVNSIIWSYFAAEWGDFEHCKYDDGCWQEDTRRCTTPRQSLHQVWWQSLLKKYLFRPVYTKHQWFSWSHSVNSCIISD